MTKDILPKYFPTTFSAYISTYGKPYGKQEFVVTAKTMHTLRIRERAWRSVLDDRGQKYNVTRQTST